MGEFRMPSLGADMTEGTLIEWLVAPGDPVHRGQIIAVIDTVKSAIDVEAFEDGSVDRLLVEPGETVEVGTPLALIAAAAASGEPRETGAAPEGDLSVTVPAASAEEVDARAVTGLAIEPAAGLGPEHHQPASPLVRRLAHDRHVDLDEVDGTGPDGTVTRADVEHAAHAHDEHAPAAPPPSAPSPAARRGGDDGHVPATPRARRRARELGLDLAGVVGSGAGGSVTVEDVERAAATAQEPTTSAPVTEQVDGAAATVAAPEPAPARAASRTADARSGARKDAMQAATAALMARSKREIPHFYLRSTIDLKASMDWLATHNAGRSSTDRVLPAALLLRATVRAALAVPELNGFYVDGAFRPAEHVDLGVAVALRSGGLVVASLREAETLGVDDLMTQLKDVATRARAGRLTSSQMSVPSITVTNLGDQGAELVQGVIYPPQVALVGFGRVVDRPWAVDGMLAVRPVVVATLAADHRVSDGHRGSRFLAALDAALQKPEEL